MTPYISENEKKYFWKNFGKRGGSIIFVVRLINGLKI
jgi:hypothetical protein